MRRASGWVSGALGAVALVAALTGCGSDVAVPGPTRTPSPSTTASTPPSASPSPHAHSSVVEFREVALGPGDGCPDPSYADASWCAAAGYSSATAREYQAFTCPERSWLLDKAAPVPASSPDKPLLACDLERSRYLLGPAAIVPERVTASVGADQLGSPTVVVGLDAAARRKFAALTSQLAGTNRLFALVVDGQVLTAATVASPIAGDMQISGRFTAAQARDIAERINR